MKGLFSLCIALLFAIQLQAQNINISADPQIDAMVAKHVEVNRNTTGLTGWRIQILASTNRAAMERSRGQFIRAYPHVRANWEYNAPYYKLRAGAFQKKIDAFKLLTTIKSDFPSAYAVKVRDVKPRDFLMY